MASFKVDGVPKYGEDFQFWWGRFVGMQALGGLEPEGNGSQVEYQLPMRIGQSREVLNYERNYTIMYKYLVLFQMSFQLYCCFYAHFS